MKDEISGLAKIIESGDYRYAWYIRIFSGIRDIKVLGGTKVLEMETPFPLSLMLYRIDAVSRDGDPGAYGGNRSADPRHMN